MGSEQRKTPGTTRAQAAGWGTALLAAVMMVSSPALARPGTHAPATSTWDTRASSVAFHTKIGFMDGGGHFHNFSYNANFTSTSGNLSAQFGLHYLNLNRGTRMVEEEQTDAMDNTTTVVVEEAFNTQHGVAASATGLLSIPVTDRTDNGIPTAAVGIYLGAVPSVLTSGNLNDLTIPIVLGLGIPYSPHKAITLTPWGEAAFSLNADAEIRPFNLTDQEEIVEDFQEFEDIQNATEDDVNDAAQSLGEDSIERILEESVDASLTFDMTFRGGLNIGIHMWDGADLDLGYTFGTISGTSFHQVGGAFVWRWDDIVPAVLPAHTRLEHETCDAVEERWLMCQTSAKEAAAAAGGDATTGGDVPAASDAPAAEEPAAEPTPEPEAAAPAPKPGVATSLSGSSAPAPEPAPTPEPTPEPAPAADPAPAPAPEPPPEPSAPSPFDS